MRLKSDYNLYYDLYYEMEGVLLIKKEDIFLYLEHETEED